MHTLSGSDSWREANRAGLALAGRGEWTGASEAFARALELIEGNSAEPGVTLAARDEIRAGLMSNVSKTCFQLEQLPEARRFAERSCALRVALHGEDSLPVARTRGDLAVIVAALGHHHEAMSLLDRAIAAVELKDGPNSELLVPLLTNATRLLAKQEPAKAEPYVTRLRAVLAAQPNNGMVAEVTTPTAVPANSFRATPLASGSDDQLLRSAIAQTVDLLRTTPTSIIATHAKLDDTLFDLVEPPPATLNSLPAAPSANVPLNPLGFEVQYGIPSQLHEPLHSTPARSNADVIAPKAATPANEVAPATSNQRAAIRAVGGVRRGSTQVAEPKRLWYLAIALLAFVAGVGAYLLFSATP